MKEKTKKVWSQKYDKTLVGTEESAEAVFQKCSVNKVFGKNGKYLCLSLFSVEFQALRPATLTICFYFLQSFLKGRKWSETSPPIWFSAWFLKKNISRILLTYQILLPDFEELHKINKKISVKFLKTPLLQNICRWLLLN